VLTPCQAPTSLAVRRPAEAVLNDCGAGGFWRLSALGQLVVTAVANLAEAFKCRLPQSHRRHSHTSSLCQIWLLVMHDTHCKGLHV